jgi:hypothetical protein
MSRKSQSFVHKTINQGLEIKAEIIVPPYSGLIDSDLSSQIHWCSDDHRIANAAPDGVLKVFNLFLRITRGWKHSTDVGRKVSDPLILWPASSKRLHLLRQASPHG